MKVSKKAVKTAKMVFKESFTANLLDEEKLSRFIKALEANPGKLSEEILAELESLIDREIRNEELLIESAYPLEPDLVTELKAKFEKLLGKDLNLVTRENKELIAGIRVSNADNRWENTVVSNLEQLKGNFANE